MKAINVMDNSVPCFKIKDIVRNVIIELLKIKKIYAPVVNDSNKVVGMVSFFALIKDYLDQLTPSDNTIQHVIITNPLIINEDIEIEKIFNNKQDAAIVVDCNQNYLGIISKYSLFDYFNSQLEENKCLVRDYNAIIESSYDGIYVADAEGVTVSVNKSYERITGLKREFLIGKNLEHLVKEGVFSQSTTLLVKKSIKPETIIQVLNNGRSVMCTGNPIFDEDGKLYKVISNVRDITELVEIYKQLKEANELNERYLAEATHLRMQQFDLQGLVAESHQLQKVIEVSAKVAQYDSSVLIYGESGVGKEVIAKIIHTNSVRRNGPFIKINCGAIPDELLESELFGYEEGAFTGAKKNGKPGLFELANDGTLFLDEIAELPINLQASLLRVLQERELIRIGGTKVKKIDVRLICATNKNLEFMVREGNFRKDLYYRLNVVPIEVPPLRERIDDIRPLVTHFLEKYKKMYGVVKIISEEAMMKLIQYNWPGNVRELANIIERTIVLSSEEVILPEHLPEYISDSTPDPQSPFNNKVDITISGVIPLDEAVKKMERILIEKALNIYGSTRKAADVLKVSQATIVRKTKNLKIVKELKN